MKLTLKVRSYPEGRFVSVWLVRVEGAAREALLFGELSPPLADKLAEALGLPAERETQPLPGAGEVSEARLARQGDLFGGAADAP